MSDAPGEAWTVWGPVADLLPVALTVFRRDDAGVVVEWVNRALATWYRREPSDFVGQRIEALYPPEVVKRILGWLAAADRDGRVVDEVERELPSGRITAEVTTAVLGDGRYLACAVDVTAQRDAERARSQLAAVTGIGTYRWVLASGEVTWSQETFALLGYEPGAVGPSVERFLSHVHPDDRGRLERNTAAAAEGDLALREMFRVVRVDGGERDIEVHARAVVDDEGAPLYVLGAIQDVTELVELERHAALGQRAAERQQTALQVHDSIVQGLTTAWLALDVGEHRSAAAAIEDATERAQQIVTVLLADASMLSGGIEPGALVRRDPEAREPADQ